MIHFATGMTGAVISLLIVRKEGPWQTFQYIRKLGMPFICTICLTIYIAVGLEVIVNLVLQPSLLDILENVIAMGGGICIGFIMLALAGALELDL